MPPATPSQVFFGLMLGAILCRPMARPVSSAPESQNLVTAISQNRSTRPVCGCGLAISTMRTRKCSMNGT